MFVECCRVDDDVVDIYMRLLIEDKFVKFWLMFKFQEVTINGDVVVMPPSKLCLRGFVVVMTPSKSCLRLVVIMTPSKSCLRRDIMVMMPSKSCLRGMIECVKICANMTYQDYLNGRLPYSSALIQESLL
jgi:hypothetical protein